MAPLRRALWLITTHASLVARESRGAWSYATVWRVAVQAGIELTEGRKTMGRPRLPPEVWANVEDAVQKHPEATQQALARQCGVSRRRSGAWCARGVVRRSRLDDAHFRKRNLCLSQPDDVLAKD